jgi:ADP-ribosylation factor-like protein 8
MEILMPVSRHDRTTISSGSAGGSRVRPKSSRLRQKIDTTYSYFRIKVDPLISACVATFLLKQPENVLKAMCSYFDNLDSKLGTDCFADIGCYEPKKGQKSYFTYNLGPVLSKLVDMIATTQPYDVLGFICQKLAEFPVSTYDSVDHDDRRIHDNAHEKEQELPVSIRRNKLNDAISLANVINPSTVPDLRTVPVPEVNTTSVAKPENKDRIASKESVTSVVPEIVKNVLESKETEKSIPKDTLAIDIVTKDSVTTIRTEAIKNIQLSILGMGGSGKTSIINALQGKFETKIKPSLGFKPTTMMLGENINVKFYDLGGGKKIRNIWGDYHHDVHAVLYVFDASLTGDDLEESIKLFEETVKHPFLSNKPLLIMANKHDKVGALSVSEIGELLKLKELVNSGGIQSIECSSFSSETQSDVFNTIEINVETDNNLPSDLTIDPRFEKGLELFLELIQKDFDTLNKRVLNDIAIK